MVTNGVYGLVINRLMKNVLIVITGEGQDKPVVGAIADFTGTGINLKKRSPRSRQNENSD